jgi:ATP-dependent 26S proteasome regulatory subunit
MPFSFDDPFSSPLQEQPMTDTATLVKKLEICRNPAIPSRARAETAAMVAAEAPVDVIGFFDQIFKEADFGREKMKEESEENRVPLVRGTFMGAYQVAGKYYAAMATPAGESYLPCKETQVAELKFGDSVLINTKTSRIEGCDGHVPSGGEVVTVEAFNEDDPSRVLVKHHEQSLLARVSHTISDAGEPLTPGQRLLLDPSTRFVHESIETESDGEELVTPVEALSRFDVNELGAANPLLDDVLFRIKQRILHPEWAERMRPRETTSYLLVGPTGTGKTLHIKCIARLLMDFIEELTGERVSPLILVDTGTFFSPLFGQTEINIKAFFRKLRKIGRRVLTTHDGRKINQPFLLVLEECESLFRSRGEYGGSSHLFDRPLALLLSELSSVGSEMDMPITTLASSNRGDLLDPAARRRIGIRQITIGPLNGGQAAAVLERKLAGDLAFRSGTGEQARLAIVNQVISYLYGGSDTEQAIAEVRCFDNSRRLICRKHVVTGAMLDEAVSAAKDECLKASAQRGELLGLGAAEIIRSFDAQYRSLAVTLKPHNVAEHCPQWFQDEPLRVESVKPLLSRSRKAAPVLID